MTVYPSEFNSFLAGFGCRPTGVMDARVKTPYVVSECARVNGKVHRATEAFTARLEGETGTRLAARYACGESCRGVRPAAHAGPFALCERCEEVVADADAPWKVYAFRDSSGVALYVGQTANLTMRRRSHAKSAPWWAAATSEEVLSRHVDRRDALAAEARAIRDLSPTHNIVHNRKRVA